MIEFFKNRNWSVNETTGIIYLEKGNYMGVFRNTGVFSLLIKDLALAYPVMDSRVFNGLITSEEDIELLEKLFKI